MTAEKSRSLLQHFESIRISIRSFQISQRVDDVIFQIMDFYGHVRIATLYKQKVDKIQPADQSDSDERASEGSNQWQMEAIVQQETAGRRCILHEFNSLVTLKFSSIKRGFCLTPKWIEKLIIEDLLSREKELFL